ncbi:holo-ACP synthase [Peribacillus loiseleuriae]|uniref:holo-ACP synthase n=1 Tax=Peribacillus loiseleuriae TaxID=1679170 RepID=UPI0038023E08
MIKGIGMDIVELQRIQKLLERQPKFIERILTEAERKTFFSLNERRRVEFAAGRFAAKEAYSKAEGTGIGRSLSFLDIEVKPNEFGKPEIIRPYAAGIHLSITHSREYAAATVIIEER